MPDVLDLLLIFPNNRARAYGELGVDIAGVIPPVQSGLTAAWFGAAPAVVLGGVCTLVVAGLWVKWFPELWRRDRLGGSGA